MGTVFFDGVQVDIAKKASILATIEINDQLSYEMTEESTKHVFLYHRRDQPAHLHSRVYTFKIFMFVSMSKIMKTWQK